MVDKKKSNLGLILTQIAVVVVSIVHIFGFSNVGKWETKTEETINQNAREMENNINDLREEVNSVEKYLYANQIYDADEIVHSSMSYCNIHFVRMGENEYHVIMSAKDYCKLSTDQATHMLDVDISSKVIKQLTNGK